MSSKPAGWDCPQDLYIGDEIEVISTVGGFRQVMKVLQANMFAKFTAWQLDYGAGSYSTFTLCSDSNDYAWRKTSGVATLTSGMKAASPAYDGIEGYQMATRKVVVGAEFGVKCSGCGVDYPDAERVAGFRCWSCKNFT